MIAIKDFEKSHVDHIIFNNREAFLKEIKSELFCFDVDYMGVKCLHYMTSVDSCIIGQRPRLYKATSGFGGGTPHAPWVSLVFITCGLTRGGMSTK